jgi:hypothetical protein
MPGTAATVGGTAKFHPRVERGVQQVGDQVGQDHHQREHEYGALDHRHVTRVDRRQQFMADPGESEDLLDDHGHAQQRAEVQRDRGDQAE